MTEKNALNSRTLTASINRSQLDVYHFVSDLKNMPVWATSFAKSIQQEDGIWTLQTDLGPLQIRIVPQNPFGILDHYVSPTPGVDVYVPMRVVPSGGGSEMIFTLFQQMGMSDEQFENDLRMVRQDLDTLKRVMENF